MKGLGDKNCEGRLRALGLLGLERRWLRGGLAEGRPPCCSKGGAGLSSQLRSNRTQGNGSKLFQGRLRLAIRKNFFMKKVVRHWNRLVVASPSWMYLRDAWLWR